MVFPFLLDGPGAFVFHADPLIVLSLVGPHRKTPPWGILRIIGGGTRPYSVLHRLRYGGYPCLSRVSLEVDSNQQCRSRTPRPFKPRTHAFLRFLPVARAMGLSLGQFLPFLRLGMVEEERFVRASLPVEVDRDDLLAVVHDQLIEQVQNVRLEHVVTFLPAQPRDQDLNAVFWRPLPEALLFDEGSSHLVRSCQLLSAQKTKVIPYPDQGKFLSSRSVDVTERRVLPHERLGVVRELDLLLGVWSKRCSFVSHQVHENRRFGRDEHP